MYELHSKKKKNEQKTDELYHYGVKGMKWGVRRYHNKGITLTNDGRKRYGEGGKVYIISGKAEGTNGKDFYIAAAGTKNAKSGGNIGNIYAKGDTKREAISNAEHELVKYLDKIKDLHYESKSTEKLRNKIQKQSFKELREYAYSLSVDDTSPDTIQRGRKVLKNLEKHYM